MASEKYVTCLPEAMDRLWFHQIILSSEPISENSSKKMLASVITPSQMDDERSKQESEHDDKQSTKPTNVFRKTRPRSSSPISAQNQSRNVRYSTKRMQKSMSCKSLFELELEEVKGFMDLGFVFKKDNLSKRVMSLIPGLQRLEYSCKNDENDSSDSFEFDTNDGFEDEDEENKGRIMRPYLSEAWIKERPELCESPLMELTIAARVYTAEDMKKHLKYWARSVASAIHQ